MASSISNSQLGVSTGAGGKLILNTEKSGSHTTTNHDNNGGAASSNVRNKKIKPYKSSQTRRMPENVSGATTKNDANAYGNLMADGMPRDANNHSTSELHHQRKF